jgi:hypothetical protein
MRIRTILRAETMLAVAAAAFVLSAAACSSGPGSFTAHGIEAVCSANYDPLDAAGTTAADEYPDITDGSQVTVTDSASHVIGTGTLSLASGSSPAEGDYTFSVRVPAGQPRYGISIGHDRGTLWFSENKMRAGAALSLGC